MKWLLAFDRKLPDFCVDNVGVFPYEAGPFTEWANGDVAQLVRADGSYPSSRGFKSLHRHFFGIGFGVGLTSRPHEYRAFRGNRILNNNSAFRVDDVERPGGHWGVPPGLDAEGHH